MFRIGSNPLGDEGVAAFVESPFAGQLMRYESRLDLRKVGMESPGCASLVRSPFLHSVSRLDLSENEIEAVGIRTLAGGNFPRLRHLNLRNNRIDDEGAIALARSPLMKSLAHLDLANNKLTKTSTDELLAARRTPQTVVDLSGNFIEEM